MDPDQAMDQVNRLVGSSRCRYDITLASNVYMRDSSGRVRYTVPINLSAAMKRDSHTGKYTLSMTGRESDLPSVTTFQSRISKGEWAPPSKHGTTARKTMKLVWTDHGLTELSQLTNKEREQICQVYTPLSWQSAPDLNCGEMLQPDLSCSRTGEVCTRCRMSLEENKSDIGRPKSMWSGDLLELERPTFATSSSTTVPTSSPALLTEGCPSGGMDTTDKKMSSSMTTLDGSSGVTSSSSWTSDPAELTIVEDLLNSWLNGSSSPATKSLNDGTEMKSDLFSPLLEDLPWFTTWNDEKIDLQPDSVTDP